MMKSKDKIPFGIFKKWQLSRDLPAEGRTHAKTNDQQQMIPQWVAEAKMVVTDSHTYKRTRDLSDDMEIEKG